MHLRVQESGGHLTILPVISTMCDCLARQVRFKNKTKIFKCLLVLVQFVSIISCSKDRRAKGVSVNYL